MTLGSRSLERQSQGHYAWLEPDLDRYRSRFNPMKLHDIIRDDMAVRMWRPGTNVIKLFTTIIYYHFKVIPSWYITLVITVEWQ
jgi:hypothetical protein